MVNYSKSLATLTLAWNAGWRHGFSNVVTLNSNECRDLAPEAYAAGREVGWNDAQAAKASAR